MRKLGTLLKGLMNIRTLLWGIGLSLALSIGMVLYSYAARAEMLYCVLRARLSKRWRSSSSTARAA